MPTLGFRFRAYTSELTLRALKAQLKLACEIYNTLRWADIYFYHRDGEGLTQTELRQLALDLRKQDDEYKQLYSQVVQQIADRYYDARSRFFKDLARFPREKKPHKYYSLVYSQYGWRIISEREVRTRSKHRERLLTLRLSNLGVFKVLVHRDFPLDEVKRVAVKLTPSERVFITFIVENVALDVGIEKMLTSSDGWFIENLKPYEKALNRLRRLHRALSRKKFLSHNWQKTKVRLAKAYEHLRNLRRDIAFKSGAFLARHYDVVVMENINVKKLVGESVRKLRMRLLDVGFHELREIIRYQVEKYGKEFRTANPAYTSKTCAKCSYVKKDLTLKDRVFICPKCGWTADHDFNASLNLLRNAGWEPPKAPAEPHPLPLLGQGGAMKQETPPIRVR
ncbi:RNA-guided endonuclease InsQ/TnpB family protein [Caldivirga maquilingensis]|uniref:Transposase, IS605 OrfB family n=1 Tax=Caldivirga maquilingensis (strain ATCC 700844 / DSM 13496 / JCM 10307 / IC-167) TaxID=397948 RepID=A8MBE2_CALMQ|nr:RNA-guided endonuclease TnpB family protein [Caldivirga maquilingensis]ABW01232.1 transposase, IS605 OrfB family [Caldivirga maquilingensis IC-167]